MIDDKDGSERSGAMTLTPAEFRSLLTGLYKLARFGDFPAMSAMDRAGLRASPLSFVVYDADDTTVEMILRACVDACLR